MTIAIFSDIHSNLPALDAFFTDVESRKPDMIYCLGDLVGYNVWPNEVINAIRKRGIPVIAGNYDEGIGKNSNECGCAYKTDEERSNGSVSISFTNQMIADEERSYLRALPMHMLLRFQLNQHSINLLLVHGSPRKINEYLFEDREEKSLLRILQDAGADIMCFGHTHKPYHRVLTTVEAGTSRHRHAINTGSVGKPKDGDPRGGYVLLHLSEDSNNYEAASIAVEFIRFEYDIEKAAGAIEASVLPGAYASALRQGR